MPRGQKTGGGSRKGRPNKHKTAFREQLRAYCAALGVDPHHFMAELVNDDAAELGLRFAAAKELAQYLEPKLKAVEHTGEIEHTVKVIEHRYGHRRAGH